MSPLIQLSCNPLAICPAYLGVGWTCSTSWGEVGPGRNGHAQALESHQPLSSPEPVEVRGKIFPWVWGDYDFFLPTCQALIWNQAGSQLDRSILATTISSVATAKKQVFRERPSITLWRLFILLDPLTSVCFLGYHWRRFVLVLFRDPSSKVKNLAGSFSLV